MNDDDESASGADDSDGLSAVIVGKTLSDGAEDGSGVARRERVRVLKATVRRELLALLNHPVVPEVFKNALNDCKELWNPNPND